MSRLTAILILGLVALFAIGGAVALAQTVTTDSGAPGTENAIGPGACINGVTGNGDWEQMKQYHEQVHGEGSWDQMQNGDWQDMQDWHNQMHGPDANWEDMEQHHEQIHGEGSWEDMQDVCPIGPGTQQDQTGQTTEGTTQGIAQGTGPGYNGSMMDGSGNNARGGGSMMGW